MYHAESYDNEIHNDNDNDGVDDDDNHDDNDKLFSSLKLFRKSSRKNTKKFLKKTSSIIQCNSKSVIREHLKASKSFRCMMMLLYDTDYDDNLM